MSRKPSAAFMIIGALLVLASPANASKIAPPLEVEITLERASETGSATATLIAHPKLNAASLAVTLMLPEGCRLVAGATRDWATTAIGVPVVLRAWIEIKDTTGAVRGKALLRGSGLETVRHAEVLLDPAAKPRRATAGEATYESRDGRAITAGRTRVVP